MPDPINITQIPAPRVELIDPRTGLMSREWFRFFNNIYSIVGANLGIVQIPNGGTGLGTYPTNGQLLIGDTAGQKYVLNTLAAGSGIGVTNGAGTIGIANTGVLSNVAGAGISVSSATGNVTVANTGVLSVTAGTGISVTATTGAITVANTGVLSFNGGNTGLTPATSTTGAITLAGTLDVDNGGTGQTTYTNGQLLIGNTTGNTLTKSTLTAGTGITISNGAGSITINGTGGTVTSVSVVSANGFAGTVANSTTTPAITLTTTITGILKGNGTAISAAVSGTDYAPATSGTSILYGNGAGGFSSVTIGTGVSFVGGTLSATGSGGTVTSVTGTAPIASSGGTTPAISISQSNTSTDGYLSSTDWNTFNNKGSGTVTSVTGTAPVVSSGGATPAISMAAASASANGYLTSTDWTTFNNKGSGSVTSVAQSFTGGLISVAGSPITTSGTLALTVAGTSGGVPYFSSGSTWASSSALAANSLVVGGGAGAAPSTVTTGTGVVTALGVNTGTAGAFVVNGGALGTPSSGVATNLTSLTAANITGSRGIPASTVPVGSVIQVVQTVLTTQFSTNSTSYTDVTGLSVSITPQFSTSKILVTANVVLSSTAVTEFSAIQLVRNSTAIGNGATGFYIFQNTSNAMAGTGVINYLDSPATTSATTYKIQALTSSAAFSAAINFRGATTGQTLSSQITVMEIAQ